ncbi:MAG: exosortase T [Pseudomonadota bacterium]
MEQLATRSRDPDPDRLRRLCARLSVPAGRLSLSSALLIAAAAIAAAGPLAWLWRTWTDPAYASEGWAAALAVALVAGWSLASPRTGPAPRRDWALGLVALTLLLRLASQVLAVGTLGGLALVVDVFALAALAGLDRRARAVSPFWLAAAFAYSLPLESILQRVFGHGLQQIAAEGACAVLGLGFADLGCAGLMLKVNGVAVLVDAPCSGARGLVLQGFLFALGAAVLRPTLPVALGMGIVALLAALLANVLRIAALAAGEGLGFAMLAEPVHSGTGLVALGLAALPVLVWIAGGLGEAPDAGRPAAPGLAAPCPTPADAPSRRLAAAGLCVLACVAVALPARPVDVARAAGPVALPARLGAETAQPVALTEAERVYFTRYGGSAASAAYGPMLLTLVQTSAPLRHLHAPSACLRGLGFAVEYLGRSDGALPTATYRATAPDGEAFRVDVSFVSEHGSATAQLGEAIWRWFAAPGTGWTMIRRITPWTLDPAARARAEAAMRAALDLTPPSGGADLRRAATLTPTEGAPS